MWNSREHYKIVWKVLFVIYRDIINCLLLEYLLLIVVKLHKTLREIRIGKSDYKTEFLV